jgi:hypothetical protein
MMMSVGQSVELVAEETKVLGENLPSFTLFTTNSTLSDLGLNSGRSGGKSTTSLLSYGKAINPLKKITFLHHIYIY